MEPIVEKDSVATALIILGAIFLLFIGGVLGLAYMGGVFTGKDAVAANDRRILQQAQLKPSPATAPEPAKR